LDEACVEFLAAGEACRIAGIRARKGAGGIPARDIELAGERFMQAHTRLTLVGSPELVAAGRRYMTSIDAYLSATEKDDLYAIQGAIVNSSVAVTNQIRAERGLGSVDGATGFEGMKVPLG
jgi:hypothetical protein